jgi:hypothetical protein
MTFTKLRALCVAALVAVILSPTLATAQAVQLPPAEQCFQATTGINGMVGTLGAITGGSGGSPGVYTNVSLTGGSGTGASANITVNSSGAVSQVVIYYPGINYVVGDTLSASVGGVTGFSVPVASISINSSLAGGTVGMYQVGTLTYAQTWQNANQTTLNTNPIQLDQNGCAIIYGVGTYRQILYDSLGNEVWDQPTSVAPVNPYWAGTATGTANAITITDPSFASVSGQSIQFVLAYTNTGSVTINGVQLLKNTNAGPVALVMGDLVAGNMVSATYNATASAWFLQVPTTPPTATLGATIGSAAGVRITNNSTTPATQINVAANSAILVNGTGFGIQVLSPSYTINAATTGLNGLDTGSLAINTWYYEWLISNGTTAGAILSLSSSSPTMPSGYTYSVRIGAAKTDASANLYLFTQYGNLFRWKIASGTNTTSIPIIYNNSTGSVTVPTWSSFGVQAGSGTFPTSCVPPTADTISIIAGGVNGASGAVIVAPNSSYGGDTSTTNPPPLLSEGGVLISKEILLETYVIYYASSSGTATVIATDGFLDSANVN